MDFSEFCLEYFQNFYQLKDAENLSNDLAKAILELGKIRGYRSHPRGDMGIIQRYMDKTGCKPNDAIDKLKSKKAVLGLNMTSMQEKWVEAKPKPKPQSKPISSQAILIRRKKQILCA